MEMSTRLGLHTMETEKGRASLVFSHGSREFQGERAGAGVNSLQKFHLNSTSQRPSPSIQTSTSTPFNSFFPDSTISRRRKLLDDYSLIALADTSWELLDISGSAVSNVGLERVPGICPNLKALDISQCDKITADAVSHPLFQCHRLEILRCGGSHRSDFTAWRCLKFLKPSLEVLEEESWEELDSSVLAKGAQSLRWLIWAKIDEDSLDMLNTDCPRILVNPVPSQLGLRGIQVPREALPNVVLDDPVVIDVDPSAWAVAAAQKVRFDARSSDVPELSLAERFRMAFVERDARLAPKRAKNARQHQRRAERERLVMDMGAKSLALASKLNRFPHNRS
ncbi:hypothetical protein AMTRI_Chr13g119880 [Amborella trichopoda]